MCLVLRASSDADGMRYGDGLGKVPGLRRIGCSQDHMQNPHPLKPEGAAPKCRRGDRCCGYGAQRAFSQNPQGNLRPHMRIARVAMLVDEEAGGGEDHA